MIPSILFDWRFGCEFIEEFWEGYSIVLVLIVSLHQSVQILRRNEDPVILQNISKPVEGNESIVLTVNGQERIV